jgi:tRNA modification GTPase
MSTFAAVMTGTGTGAISTVQLFGEGAEGAIGKIFRSAHNKPISLKTGKIFLGTIVDGGKTIDQVTIGCEGVNTFAINCHGNPLIVEMIMQLLGKNGVTLITAEQLLAKILTAEEHTHTIEVEAKIFQARAETIEGTKIILNQINGGLGAKAQNWLGEIETRELKEIKDEAAAVLENSKIAKSIMYGCTIVLAGPANSGKSTLLNFLAGKQKAIVTDIKGTTRDWVSSKCKIGTIIAEIIDTAGLDEQFAQTNDESIESQAQKKSLEVLQTADLVLLVLDGSQPDNQFSENFIKKMADKKILTVINKSDLPAKLKVSNPAETVQISAKFGTGIENLLKKIQQNLGVAGFDSREAVCFTDRQQRLVKRIVESKSKDEAVSAITELLNGRIEV